MHNKCGMVEWTTYYGQHSISERAIFTIISTIIINLNRVILIDLRDVNLLRFLILVMEREGHGNVTVLRCFCNYLFRDNRAGL